MNPWIDNSMPANLASRREVLILIENQDFAAAEAIVDAHISDPAYGVFMPLRKAELLAQRDADAEALDMYLGVFDSQNGEYVPHFIDLSRAFLLAEGLERWADADQIGTLLLAHQRGGLGEYVPLQTPTVASTANERLAYTYLALAHDAHFSDVTDFTEAYQQQVEYCLKAKALLPNSTIVLVHLALAFHYRDGINAIGQCRTLLTQAYNQEAGNTEMREEIQDWARSCGVTPFP